MASSPIQRVRTTPATSLHSLADSPWPAPIQGTKQKQAPSTFLSCATSRPISTSLFSPRTRGLGRNLPGDAADLFVNQAGGAHFSARIDPWREWHWEGVGCAGDP